MMKKKNRAISAILAGILIVGALLSGNPASAQASAVTAGALANPESAAWVNPFTDVHEGDWFYNDVGYVYTNGLMAGTGTNPMVFSPGVSLTRGMIVTVLYRQEGSPSASGLKNPFNDAPPGEWYTDAVVWAAANGIVLGYGNGKFGPADNVTREQLVTVLWNYCKWKGIDVSVGENTNILSYQDAFGISEYAIPAMQWACGAGVVTGSPDGYLKPGGQASRAEAAAMLHRLNAQMIPGSSPSELLAKIISEAREGRVINCPCGNQQTIDDFIKLWGDPGESTYQYITEAKGMYVIFPNHNVTVGMNKGAQVFEVRNTDKAALGIITFSDIQSVFGRPVFDSRDVLGMRIIGYHINNDYNIEFILKNNSDSATLDHYNVLWPQGTVNQMADDPGRQW